MVEAHAAGLNVDWRALSSAALGDLRRARRRRRMADIDVFEALYRSYLTAILVGIAILLLSGVTGDKRLGAEAVDRVRSHGPAVAGLAGALAVFIGCRSGGRGGPLVIEAADVRHVLLSPVDRTLALRGPALRQLRFAAFLGMAVGAVAGLLALRRLPGTPGWWVLTGAAAGVGIAVTAIGAAIVVSGLRLGRFVGNLLGLLVVGWSVADLVAGVSTSPLTLLGRVAVWPLHFDAVALAGFAAPVIAVVVGFGVVGGTSLEAAERRASLAGQLRFAATLQDIRTVVVLRRQLAQERPRQRPWIRLRRVREGGDVRLPVWRRGWHGILRWPLARWTRVALLGGIAGVALVGVWRGTTPLVVVAGLALYIAGLDAVEPLAQDADHPDRLDSYPLTADELHFRQIGPSIVVAGLIGVVAIGVAAAVSRRLDLVLPIGAVMLAPIAVVVPSAAAMSAIKGPPGGGDGGFLLPPEAAGMQMMFRLAWPPAMCVLAVLPMLAGRVALKYGHSVVGFTVQAELGVVVLAGGALGWVRYQHQVHKAITESFKAAGSG